MGDFFNGLFGGSSSGTSPLTSGGSTGGSSPTTKSSTSKGSVGKSSGAQFTCPDEATYLGMPVEHWAIIGVFTIIIFIGLLGLIAPSAEEAAPFLV